jgi:hypothetical protein
LGLHGHRATSAINRILSLTELEHILSQSQAAETFKRSVRIYYANGGAEHIRVEGSAPKIKVKRLLAHILAAEPTLPIEYISLRAKSGCSEFVWDCRWRAEQEGWTDCFGYPDQIRAAREYDWRCFERWEPIQPGQPTQLDQRHSRSFE